ncbi:hypothetical protein GUITHDRAFT_105875 [Guillardia theta CCMP2712]|uniref:Uncharacterized protein n=1 Tax=Guillardia theta (strain CCMP2712) TaxID=905079 RepID=L1JIG2_GUITC|nr:hypothetical protein GUITHDRAFT_105875 [Guillardia theta CCMP2712]EKX48271.1 hypothetical protein GUITHDRAFT_105875 [Guillardia theta CCMP2712]|eukprot:XP_005835251.1 hypothetical protein GUITHDRAFT_105875 [Guillardia theta CCMP2712]
MSSWKSKILTGNVLSFFQNDPKETNQWCGNNNEDKAATQPTVVDSSSWQQLGRRRKSCLGESRTTEQDIQAKDLSLKSQSLSSLSQVDFEHFFGAQPLSFRQNPDVGSFVSCRDGSGLPKCLGRRLSDHTNASFQINVQEIVKASSGDDRLKEVLQKLKD